MVAQPDAFSGHRLVPWERGLVGPNMKPIPFQGVAIVELDEGWHLRANILDCAPEDVRIGMRVEALFEVLSDEITLPCFVPASA